MYDQLANIAIVLATAVLGWALRALQGTLRWRRIRELAARELDSPEGTNDPETALERATVSVNRPRIQSETQRLQSRATPLTARLPRKETDPGGTDRNGSHGT